MSISSNQLWLVIVAVVFFAPAIIVACSQSMKIANKPFWLAIVLVFSWIGFLGYLATSEREFLE